MNDSPQKVLRLGTRGSRLAVAQSRQIADALIKVHFGLQIQLVTCKTTGDRILDRPLQSIGGKGLFVKEIEEALLRKEIDFAVHSFKDLPVTEPLVDESELVVAAVPARADYRDVLSSDFKSIASLPRAAVVGTGSLRRRCQLIAHRPDLQIRLIRGNIDTRLAKLAAGTFDAVVLAAAGLKRCGLFEEKRDHFIAIETMLPAAAQGALALQCRREDSETINLLQPLDDPQTRLCTDMERAVVAELHGDCHSPIAALAVVANGMVRFRAKVGRRGGELPIVEAEESSTVELSTHALHAVVDQLNRQNVRDLLS